MDPDARNALHPALDIRRGRVSTVVVQRVPPDRVEAYLDCQRGFAEAAEGFPGYQGSELYPPAEGRAPDWVAVIHFDTEGDLRLWLDSPRRAEWTAKLRDRIGDFRLKTLKAGFGAWFAGLVSGPDDARPPSWKMALTVLTGLYPTVMVLALILGRRLEPLGMAVAMLISNVLSVSICQWLVIPPLTKVLAPWLGANAPGQWRISLAGLLLIALLLGAVATLFRLVEG